jgi:Family of unknown function (DUF6152)
MNCRIGAVLALGVLLAGAAWSHHNMTALFDLNDRVTLTGTLTRVDWRNPHIYLSVEVINANRQTETWEIEGPPPSFFRTRDIAKTDFENALGKTVTAEASRARDHSPSGLIRTITLPGGKVVSACPQNC